MERLFKRIEILANVAIILVAILLGIVVLKKHVFVPSANTESTSSQSQPRIKINLLGVDWSKNKTLVLAISNSCHFCTESAPFYRELAQSHQGTKLIAILPQPVEVGKQYLSSLGVQVDDILQAPLNSINVSGTPTLMLVDLDGVVTHTWVGRLPAEQETEVLTELKVGQINSNHDNN